MNSRISVAMAVYNGERYLDQQLDSILGQTYQDFELVISDDASTDTSLNIIRRRALNDPRIHIIAGSENIGFIRNFERALTHCTGEFIALADQDDVWHHQKLATLILSIDHYDAIASDAELIDENNKIIAHSFREHSSLIIPKFDDTFDYLLHNNCFTGCTMMFRTHLLNAILPFPQTIMYHDWWIALIAASRNGINYLTDQLVQYRRHRDNITRHRNSPAASLHTVFPYLYNRRQRTEEQYQPLLLQLEALFIRLSPVSSKLERALTCAIYYYRAYLAKMHINLIRYGLQCSRLMYYRKPLPIRILRLMAKII